MVTAALTGVCLPSAALAGQPDVHAKLAVTEAPTAAAAIAAARRSGDRVEVSTARSELTQVFAEPSGMLTLESAVVPQRARRADGSWAPIDLGLVRAGDGLWRPAVSVADVRFSGGGSAPLAALVRDGKRMTVSWPEALPTPMVSGELATYAEVFPDVDLVVRATRTGFSHVLVIKTPQAAANPAVRQVSLRLGGDARVSAVPGGGLRALVGNQVLASAEPAVMWDSTTTPSTTNALGAMAANQDENPAIKSTVEGPSHLARTAPVTTEVTSSGDVVLKPDPELLSADESAFPLYVDPEWATGKSRWGYAASNNKDNSDATSRAMVGLNPKTGALYRSYFEFSTSPLRGKHIESAYVQMKLDHSWSCDDTWTHLYHTSTIGSTPRTKWKPSNIKWLASAESHANEDDGCGTEQNDMTVNFRNDKVGALIQTVATNKTTGITMGLCACNDKGDYESAQDRWKKFYPNNAKLVVNYSSFPGKPTDLKVSGVACLVKGRVSIGTLTPTLSAMYTDADPDQKLSASYEWLEIPASGTYNDSTPRKSAPAPRSVPAGTRGTSAGLTGVQQGKAYAFRTRAKDPDPYNLTSPWSAWCEFIVDTTVPVAPGITVVKLPDSPGKPAKFALDSPDKDVIKFRYGWTDSAISEINAEGTATKSAEVTLTTPRYGLNTLSVFAIDATGNKGNHATYEFIVEKAASAVAGWRLETYPGVDQDQALADTHPTVAGDTPLGATGVAWTLDERLIGGKTATFNGASTQGIAPGSALDTSKSFGVSAWVKVNNVTTFHTIVSKDGGPGQGSTFRLQLRPNPARWCLTLATDLTSTTGTTYGCSSVTPVANQWTHVAATYDQTMGKIGIWVNGTLTEVSFIGGVNSDGAVVVGRAVNAGTAADWLNGALADVQIFDRVLVAHDLTGQSANEPESGGIDRPGILSPVQVGQWSMDRTVACYVSTVEHPCQAPEVLGWNRHLALTAGVDVGLGSSERGLLLNGTHWIDDPTDPYFEATTQEYGQSQRNLAAEDAPAQWQDTPILRTDQSFTVSAWVNPDSLPTINTTFMGQDGGTVSAFFFGIRQVSKTPHWSFMMKDSDDPSVTSRFAVSESVLTEEDTGRWTHLVGVYDVQRNHMRLYVDGVLQGEPVARPTSPWQTSGPLSVGRGLYNGAPGDFYTGGIDEVSVYQGAMTDAAVAVLHESQSVEEPS